MKVLLDKYPLGSIPRQQTAGRYIDGQLYENLDILSQKIVNDMTFLAVIFSSTLEVGTGKSVFATQIGEVWSELMKKNHNIDIPFTTKNVVWRPKQLIECAFQVPKYSYILLDEWEDAHYWSELGMTLRQFFRKCRQLNLFIMCIIPSWFEFPKGYALSRSVFAIDVRFEGAFERGYFRFYDFKAKKNLYIKGKKEHNYDVVRYSFTGRFTDGYGVPKQEYIDAKLSDLKHWEEDEPTPQTSTEIKAEFMQKFLVKFPNLTTKDLQEITGLSERTIYRYKSREIEGEKQEVAPVVV